MATTINASTSAGLVSTADTSGVLQLQTANTTALTISASQATTLAGSLTFSAADAGITFNKTGALVNSTLNDYEAGTWTPTLLGSTTNPTVAVTGTGYYTKIGNLVTVNAAFVSKSTVGGVGYIKVGGLPFNIVNTSTNTPTGAVALYGFTITGSPYIWSENSTQFGILQSNSAAAWSGVDISAGTNKYIYFNIYYYV